VVDAKTLDDGAEGVLEELEADVREMAGDVRECEILWADELYRWAFEHGVVFFADETSIFDGFLHDVVDVLLRTLSAASTEEEDNRRTALVHMMPT